MAADPLVVSSGTLAREFIVDVSFMVYIYFISLVHAFFAPFSSRLNLLLVGPAPDRVRLHSIEGRPELEGFHATKLTGLDRRVVDGPHQGRWIGVMLLDELIFVHEETESTPVASGLLSQATYSTGSIAVVEQSGRGYGMVALHGISQGEVVLEEDALLASTIDEADDDPEVVAINDDARTVLALAQMRLGSAPRPEEWNRLPGMKNIADRVTVLQSQRAFDSMPPEQCKRWMGLCDSSQDSLVNLDGSKLPSATSAVEKSAAGVLHSNGFGGTSDGTRTVLMFEKLSRCNHSCAPNVDMQTSPKTVDQGTRQAAYTARLIALRDIAAGEELTLSYLGSIGSARMEMPVEERRTELRRQYRFHCECERCGLVSPAARRRYERLEAAAQLEDDRVCADVAAYNAGALR